MIGITRGWSTTPQKARSSVGRFETCGRSRAQPGTVFSDTALAGGKTSRLFYCHFARAKLSTHMQCLAVFGAASRRAIFFGNPLVYCEQLVTLRQREHPFKHCTQQPAGPQYAQSAHAAVVIFATITITAATTSSTEENDGRKEETLRKQQLPVKPIRSISVSACSSSPIG